MTIQVVALIGFMAVFAWLISNTVANLHALGKDFNFGFLTVRSGYDINQISDRIQFELDPFSCGDSSAF